MKRLYETHLPVSDLGQAVAFYRDVVGLEPAFSDTERNVAFMWIGSREESMLGLWGPGSPYGPSEQGAQKSHFAIQVSLAELLQAPAALQAHGVNSRQFGGNASHEPSVIGWMPSAQIYFTDPDGHSVEYIALLDEQPEPGFIGSWSDWKMMDRRKQ